MCFGALLVGAWCHAPLLHVPRGERYGTGCCAACGCICDDLDVHLLLGGGVGGVPVCSCARAAVVRTEWERRVTARLQNTAEGRALRLTAPGSRARLGVMLGGKLRLPNGRWVYMRQAASFPLPSIFMDTWGAWSAKMERDGEMGR